MKIYNNIIVLGLSNGNIRFYDDRFRLVFWINDMTTNSIVNISFGNECKQSVQLKDNKIVY